MCTNRPTTTFQGSVGRRAQRPRSECMADIEASKMIVSTGALVEVGRIAGAFPIVQSHAVCKGTCWHDAGEAKD